MNNIETINHLEKVHGWNNDSFALMAKRGVTLSKAHQGEHDALGEDLLNHSHAEKVEEA